MFYQIRLVVFYKNIHCTLGANAKGVERKMREKIMNCRFFILYNNTNFYKYMRDTCIFN